MILFMVFGRFVAIGAYGPAAWTRAVEWIVIVGRKREEKCKHKFVKG